ncbi:hypothetical protein [Spiroplasma culicicola]|uniref:Uncharacterized protein n=1 Tax=Spiroplasma culicicola AES-1 TaxID=1276246 RepID=W6A6M5_9MOLU|nr:hypothetical protein [Spiroplasma culicicola]AHI52733.1 hypothetical protein SCULI_v1c03920 [Spiroplasma culicicola AES-1]
MSEKVYQLNSEQIGAVSFDEPWFLCHVEIEESDQPFQIFFPSLELGIKKFAPFFEENVISKWQALGPEGEAKIQRLRDYLLTTWWNPGVETMREAMFQQYAYPEFRDKSGTELINDGFDFMAVTIGHITLRHNKMHFYFEGLHISARVVDKFLAVNFWDKVKTEALSLLGTTVLK